MLSKNLANQEKTQKTYTNAIFKPICLALIDILYGKYLQGLKKNKTLLKPFFQKLSTFKFKNGY